MVTKAVHEQRPVSALRNERHLFLSQYMPLSCMFLEVGFLKVSPQCKCTWLPPMSSDKVDLGCFILGWNNVLWLSHWHCSLPLKGPFVFTVLGPAPFLVLAPGLWHSAEPLWLVTAGKTKFQLHSQSIASSVLCQRCGTGIEVNMSLNSSLV